MSAEFPTVDLESIAAEAQGVFVAQRAAHIADTIRAAIVAYDHGLCRCGCGQSAPLAHQTDRKKGHVVRQPVMYVRGHNNRGRALTCRRAERRAHKSGYTLIRVNTAHPRAKAGFVMEHILVAERALGRFLPRSVPVHHVDENKTNNQPRNLVVCQDHAYHALLHVRMRAYRACANANYRKCMYCPQYDDPATMRTIQNRFFHVACRRARDMRRRRG